jgi:hypothetical protein
VERPAALLAGRPHLDAPRSDLLHGDAFPLDAPVEVVEDVVRAVDDDADVAGAAAPHPLLEVEVDDGAGTVAVLLEHVDPVARMQGAHRLLDLAGPQIGEVPHVLSVPLPVHRGDLGPAGPLRTRAGLTTAGRCTSLKQ